MKNKLPLITLGLLIAFAVWQNQPEKPVQPKVDPDPVLPWPMPEPEPTPKPCPGPI